MCVMYNTVWCVQIDNIMEDLNFEYHTNDWNLTHTAYF